MTVLAGCGGETDVDDDLPSAPGSAAAQAPLVVLLRSGGIAGVSDRVSVVAIGVATIVSDRADRRSTRTLSSADLERLKRDLGRADMGKLQRNYLDRQARDAYQFDVTYKGITVTADERVVPAPLRPVVDQLTKLIAE